MRERIERVIGNRRVQAGWDFAIAFVLAASALLSIALRDDASWGRTRPLAVILVLLTSVPVAWRSQRPLLAAAIVLLGNGACAYAAAPHEAGFQPFVALALVSYSVGSRFEGTPLLPPLLAALAIPLFVASVVHGQSAGNAIPNYLWLCAAWAVGRTVRSWRMKSVALELANRELAEQRELQAEAAVAVERGRIARELHDVIAHNVSMIVVQAGAAARVLEGPQPDVRTALEAIETTGRATVDEMRRLLGVLRRSDDGLSLAPQPGLSELDKLVAGVREAGLRVELRVEGRAEPLPAALELTAFRIAQEALTNALKHAGGASAELTLRYAPDAVEIELRDTGSGNGAGPGTGHGLIGMRERVALWGGRLEAGRTDGGWLVRARLPLGADA